MSSATPLASPRAPRLPSPARVWVPALGFMLFGVLGAALGHVWVRLEQLQTGYALSREQREARVLAETQKRLRLEAAVLKQPRRIERIARNRLGMIAPDPSTIHVVRVPRSAARRTRAPALGGLAGGKAVTAPPSGLAGGKAVIAPPSGTGVAQARVVPVGDGAREARP